MMRCSDLECGATFGTCHPFNPVRPKRSIVVLRLRRCTPTLSTNGFVPILPSNPVRPESFASVRPERSEAKSKDAQDRLRGAKLKDASFSPTSHIPPLVIPE